MVIDVKDLNTYDCYSWSWRMNGDFWKLPVKLDPNMWRKTGPNVDKKAKISQTMFANILITYFTLFGVNITKWQLFEQNQKSQPKVQNPTLKPTECSELMDFNWALDTA